MERDKKERPAVARPDAAQERDSSLDAILARHGERRLDPGEFERQFGALPGDDEG